MKISATFTLLLLLSCEVVIAGISPTRLTCEYLINPQVIDIANPRLSWINIDKKSGRNQYQTAWQVRVSGLKEDLLNGKAELWNSEKVSSEESVNIIYMGKPLVSRQDCWWQVRVWDKDGKVSAWSEPAFWSMGILKQEEWKAKWIGAPWQGEEPIADSVRPLTASRAKPGQTISNIYTLKAPPPAPMLRKEFRVNKEIASARAYVTGLGYFELYLNGKKVGIDVLVPNQTNYGKRPDLGNNPLSLEDNFKEYRVMYLSYDIKEQLKKGDNAIGAIIGNGFYNAPINWTESYGTPRFIGQIYVKYTDGTEDLIISDQSWKASKSPVIMDLIYDGEHYDARLEQPDWCTPGFDDSKWERAALRRSPEGIMKAQMSPPDRVMERIKPYKIDKLGEGHYKIDFGQEISGWVRLSGIIGEKGRKIDIKYLHQTPSGDNSYTLKGSGLEFYAARFTWFVFREVEIINWPGEFKPGNIKAEAVYTNVETTGHFECSNELLNSINKIWWRSQTDNMHGGIASDCPNRERSPYTGDGQVACVTVMHNFDARAFYTKWIQDILGAQNVNTGYVPNGAPWQPGCGGGVAWGAAICIMPWEFYLHYADTNMLRDNYEGMKGYIKYMLTWTDSTGIMFSQALGPNGKPNRWMNLGDWSQPDKLPPDDVVHTFYLWRCADLTARSAKVLGKVAEYDNYTMLAERTRHAFQTRFYDMDNGTYGAYGGNIFALKMGVPDDQKERVVAALKADIVANEGHLDTGIFGTQFFFEVLSENGLHEMAYEAMNKRTAPGYGWWIEQGATTSWEGWTDPGSGNHPMFGGGIVWLYRYLAGMNVDPEHPGYRNIIFCPEPVQDISSASYSNMTPYGIASIKWEKENGKFITMINVPVGSSAIVHIPAANIKKVRESGKKIGKKSAIKEKGFRNGYAVFSVGSGRYQFESEISQNNP
ncbi:MAG TPA: family 78 glycoside hydrolase catalytic domain [Bacteroidales bacterium]|nr:family 78 glycoside hydrolase catalytic domain [Bacteroidales bacterium]